MWSGSPDHLVVLRHVLRPGEERLQFGPKPFWEFFSWTEQMNVPFEWKQASASPPLAGRCGEHTADVINDSNINRWMLSVSLSFTFISCVFHGSPAVAVSLISFTCSWLAEGGFSLDFSASDVLPLSLLTSFFTSCWILLVLFLTLKLIWFYGFTMHFYRYLADRNTICISLSHSRTLSHTSDWPWNQISALISTKVLKHPHTHTDTHRLIVFVRLEVQLFQVSRSRKKTN